MSHNNRMSAMPTIPELLNVAGNRGLGGPTVLITVGPGLGHVTQWVLAKMDFVLGSSVVPDLFFTPHPIGLMKSISQSLF